MRKHFEQCISLSNRCEYLFNAYGSLGQNELAIMDETDSGLDIDALKIIADGVNKYRNANRSFLVITHYQRLLRYIEPDVVHVLIDGKFVRSGGKELALELEEKGYQWLEH